MSTVYGNIGHCIGTLYKMLSPCQLTSDDLATETNALAHYCHRLTGKKSKQPNLPRPYCLVIGIKQLPPLFSVCPQHCYHCSVMLLHRIPRQAGSFGDGRELRDLRVEAHIVPQLALFFVSFSGGAMPASCSLRFLHSSFISVISTFNFFSHSSRVCA